MLSAQTARHLEMALRELRYGSIQLVVHDGQIVRIERIERIRLTDPSGATPDALGQPTPTPEVRHAIVKEG